jgi:hypothetical protein
MARRSYGTGSIFERSGSYYGQWRVAGRLVKRRLGPVRPPGAREGVTRTQAEARLRKLIEGALAAPPVVERVTVEQAGGRLLAQLATLGRKRSTTEGYES